MKKEIIEKFDNFKEFKEFWEAAAPYQHVGIEIEDNDQKIIDKMKGELRPLLKSGIVAVVFRKRDSSVRVMECTLSHDVIKHPFTQTDTPKESNTQVVYDIDKLAWRSFKYETLISYEVFE